MTQQTEKAGIRINKALAEAGLCSRREADRWIAEGKVCINGAAAAAGDRVMPGDLITVNGQEVHSEEKKVILAVNKPAGVVCTTDRRWGDTTLTDMVGYPVRLFSVGRLDKASEGLILMTNDGDLMNEVLRARNYHEKEYQVRVDRPVTPAFLKKMSEGVEILDTVTRPCKVEKTGEKQFKIILTQGLNRQIRRMCEALGYRVRHLRRVRIMNIELRDLPVGSWREVTGAELYHLEKAAGVTPSGTVHLKREKA